MAEFAELDAELKLKVVGTDDETKAAAYSNTAQNFLLKWSFYRLLFMNTMIPLYE